MIKKTILLATATFSIATLTGCASIVSGTHQSVSVDTGTVTGASCSLENDKGQWFVPQTPGSVVVNRSFRDMTITCTKKGYPLQYNQVASKTKGMVFGNVVFGGIIGAGVDIVDGAAYDYPQTIMVPMHKKELA